MKNKAAVLAKRFISLLSSTMAVKSKADTLRARVSVFSLLKSRRLPLISHKIHALLHRNGDDNVQEEDGGGDQSNNGTDPSSGVSHSIAAEESREGDDEYPDLTPSVFEEEAVASTTIVVSLLLIDYLYLCTYN
ncbi:hypothetical protein Nepgr_023826 [Nepenthes gracilis]|uniref:Uncharacterized protein n=1 Tax=Nepenthes gracilis TaxID=150966 RepID=A0AAD3T2V0_NEPGR|nr:hypothetical protein Nepgr_023826 [Nepenthes gracilis]